MDQVWVLLLRGVNVGGRHRLAMADFRILLDSLGFQGVATHIQSGNAVFRAPADPDLAQRIGAAITAKFGFPAEVFLLPLANYLSVLQANPFTAEGIEDGAKVHVFFLARPAPETNLAALATLAAAQERFALTDTAFYLHAPAGVGRSVLVEKLARHLKAPMTARNQRTAHAIADLARTLQEN